MPASMSPVEIFERGCFGREARRERRLAREIEVARVLDDGAERHVAQALARELVARHEGLQHGRHHVLVRAAGVSGMRAAERNANSADDGDPTSLKTEHTTLRSNSTSASIKARGAVRRRVLVEIGTLQSPP
jgi:hypothetical protein